jgi:hypothetical protein
VARNSPEIQFIQLEQNFMCRANTFSVLLLIAMTSLTSINADDPQPTAFSSEQLAFFREQVQGILTDNCVRCHSGTAPKGGLNLTERELILKGGESGPAVDLKNVGSSLLLSAVRFDGLEMPPTGRMPQAKIDALTRWLEQGLPWPSNLPAIAAPVEHGPPPVNEQTRSFWSFRPVQPVAVPLSTTEWGYNSIDQFVHQRLKDAALSPSAAADPRQLIRRASYDLTGLPPAIEDVEAFAADPSQSAWHAVIESLLNSPHYGERWGRHWLDLVRYAETNSYERDGAKPHVWRYRDYVIQSLNMDKPYDQFLIEQLAGDELPDRSPDAIVATGFYRIGRWDDEPVDHEVAFYDDMDDIVTTTSQAFLGLTINCARCHDHKIDPIPQADYYRMLAFFQNVRRFGVRSPESVEDASVVTIEKPEDSRLFQTMLAAYEQEVTALRASLSATEQKIVADLTGGERDDFQDAVNRLRLIEKREGTLLTAQEVRQYRRNTKRMLWLNDHRPSGMGQALCVKEDLKSQRPSRVLLRGNPHAPGPDVTAGFPAVLTPPEITLPEVPAAALSSGRRSVLAKWIASRENPLTARVAVNRIWQYHFGRGIVRTSSDFGFQGSRPTHPELLDWLAAQFVENGWSMKQMHRLIMQSAAYQMSSAGNSVAAAKDPNNDLFWRFDMRRLSAEEIRDSVLAVNGSLNAAAMYGPGVFTKIPAEVKAGQSMPGSGWGESSPEDQARRSIYIHVKRSLLDPVLEGFDFADTDQSCPVRFTTTQPTQALSMLNSDFAVEQSRVFAKLLGELSDQPEKQVEIALQRATQRTPRPDEIARGLSLMQQLQSDNQLSADDARVWFCLMTLNLNEMIYVD